MRNKLIMIFIIFGSLVLSGCENSFNENSSINTINIVELPNLEEVEENIINYDYMYPSKVDEKEIIPFDYIEMNGSTMVGVSNSDAFIDFIDKNDGKMIFPYGITSFGRDFEMVLRYQPNMLSEIIFPNSVEYFAPYSMSLLGETQSSFKNPDIKHNEVIIHMPSSPYYISDVAFTQINNIKEIDLSNAKNIDGASIYGSSDLEHIILPVNLSILCAQYDWSISTTLNSDKLIEEAGYIFTRSPKFIDCHDIKKYSVRGNGEDVIIDAAHHLWTEIHDVLSISKNNMNTEDYTKSFDYFDQITKNSQVTEYPPNKDVIDVIKYSPVIANNRESFLNGGYDEYQHEPLSTFDYKKWYLDNDIIYPSVSNYLENNWYSYGELETTKEINLSPDERFPGKCTSPEGIQIYCDISDENGIPIPITEKLPEDLTGYRNAIGDLLIFDENGYPIVNN